MLTLAEMHVYDVWGRNAEEDESAFFRRNRSIEQKGPIGQTVSRVDEETMSLLPMRKTGPNQIGTRSKRQKAI